jgi:hypothetical protein
MAAMRALVRRVRAYQITDNFVLAVTWISAATVWAVATYLGLPE